MIKSTNSMCNDFPFVKEIFFVHNKEEKMTKRLTNEIFYLSLIRHGRCVFNELWIGQGNNMILYAITQDLNLEFNMEIVWYFMKEQN